MSTSQPNRIRDRVLFAFGALFGLILGFYALAATRDVFTFAAGLMAFSAMGGFLSARYGVRFWEMIGRQWWIP